MTNPTPNRFDRIDIDVRRDGARKLLNELQATDFGLVDWAGLCRIIGRLERSLEEILEVVDDQAGRADQ